MIVEKKYYTIREGKKIWIFDSWSEVQSLVVGFSGAKYKSFPTRGLAEKALQQGREHYYQIIPKKKVWKSRGDLEDVPFVKEAIAVDAACSDNPWILEYRGVDLQTGAEIFHQRFLRGTNNVGEFLAIVHGLAYLQQENESCWSGLSRRSSSLNSSQWQVVAIYSDSKIAMSWVREGKCKSKLRATESNLDVRKAVDRAEEWLKVNGIKFTLLKWKTEDRGEIPADFGRK